MSIKLEKEFHEAMINIYHLAKSEANYNATRYLQMISEQGGLQTAKILINSKVPSEGYTELWKRGRLDITVEALVVNNTKWHSLFEDQEIKHAKHRLHQYGYEI